MGNSDPLFPSSSFSSSSEFSSWENPTLPSSSSLSMSTRRRERFGKNGVVSCAPNGEGNGTRSAEARGFFGRRSEDSMVDEKRPPLAIRPLKSRHCLYRLREMDLNVLSPDYTEDATDRSVPDKCHHRHNRLDSPKSF